MDRVPWYLVWHLLSIRSHSCEDRYLAKRYEDKPFDYVNNQTSMDQELKDLGLIKLSNSREARVFDAAECGSKRPFEIVFPVEFAVTPAGHYLLRTLALRAVGSMAKTFLVALVGALAALFVAA